MMWRWLLLMDTNRTYEHLWITPNPRNNCITKTTWTVSVAMMDPYLSRKQEVLLLIHTVGQITKLQRCFGLRAEPTGDNHRQHGGQAQSVTIAEPLALALSFDTNGCTMFRIILMGMAVLPSGYSTLCYVWSPSGGTLETATGLRAEIILLQLLTRTWMRWIIFCEHWFTFTNNIECYSNCARCAGSPGCSFVIFPSGGHLILIAGQAEVQTHLFGAVAAGIYSRYDAWVFWNFIGSIIRANACRIVFKGFRVVSDKMRLLVLLHQVEQQIILINGILAATTASFGAAPQKHNSIYSFSYGCEWLYYAPQTIQVNVFPGWLLLLPVMIPFIVGHSANLSVNQLEEMADQI